jgi:hypothetical protein
MAFYSDSKLNKNLVFTDNGEIRSVNFENYVESGTRGYSGRLNTDTYYSAGIGYWKSGGGDNFKFGKAVAISNHKIIVGAPGVFENGQNAGKVYVYNFDGTEYSSFQNSYVQTDSQIGFPLAAGNNRIVVGSNNRDSISVHDFDGNQLWTVQKSSVGFPSSISVACGRIVVGAKNYTPNDRGRVYIYDLDGTELQSISNSNDNGLFGSSVSINSGIIVVGEPGTTGGLAYMYDLFGMKLGQLSTTLNGFTAEFGYSSAIGANRIAVGAPNDEISNQPVGSVHLYDLYGNLIKKITPPITTSGQKFGYSIAISGNTIFVGAPGDGTVTATVYTYDLEGNYKEQITQSIYSSNTQITDNFGESIAVGHGRLIIGDSAWTIGSGQSNNGAAYLYSINNTTYEDYLERISNERNTKYSPES